MRLLMSHCGNNKMPSRELSSLALQSQNNIVREFPRAVLKPRWKGRKKGKAYSPELSIKEHSFTKPK